MAYIGLPPKANFTSGLLDRFTSTTGTTVTLTHDIASENDIVVFVNFVKQDSTTYSVGGTGNKTLTLGGTLVSSDIVEVHYLNIVGQTVAPSSGSVGSSQLTADSITGQTAETSIATDDTVLIHDTSAGALRKMTRANFVSGVGGDNTPAFSVYKSSDQSLSDNVNTKVSWDAEFYDTDNAFASNKFTVPSGEDGKYFLHTKMYSTCAGNSDFNTAELMFYKNGARIDYAIFDFRDNPGHQFTIQATLTLPLVASDYIEVYLQVDDGSGNPSIKGTSTVTDGIYRSIFEGFKLIGV